MARRHWRACDRHRPDRDRPRRRRRRRAARSTALARTADPAIDVARSASALALRSGRVAVCALHDALVATALLPYFDLANIVMLFLLTVVLVGASVRARSGDAGGVAQRRRVRFLLRAAATHLRGDRRAIPAHVRGDARGRADHRAADRGPALPGARRVASRRARRCALRVCPRPVAPARRPSRSSTPPPRVIDGIPGATWPCWSRTTDDRIATQRRRAARWRWTSASRSGLRQRASRPASAPTPCRAARSCTCRCAAPMRTRGVLAIRPERRARAAHSRAAPSARHLRRARRDCARAGALRRGGAARADPDGVRAAAQFAAHRALARSAHAARGAGRAGRVSRDDRRRRRRATQLETATRLPTRRAA